MTTASAQLWIGPAGWSYDDWNGIVYPQPRPRGFKPLSYLARFFNSVEVNSSFYRIPSPRMTAAWPRQVPERFRFAFKLTQDFTHRRSAFPPQRDVDAFITGVQPIRDAGLLGPLLMQFPWSFRYTDDNVDWLRRLADAFNAFERFIEVRHATWACDEGRAAIAATGAWCNIDQPALRDCVRPTSCIHGGSAYVRLHGRNARNWFADNQPAFERYNYTYTPAEIREWVGRLNEMRKQAQQVYVYANNHYAGQAPANALEIRALLEGEPVDVPSALLAAFPRLKPIARTRPDGTLFDRI